MCLSDLVDDSDSDMWQLVLVLVQYNTIFGVCNYKVYKYEVWSFGRPKSTVSWNPKALNSH